MVAIDPFGLAVLICGRKTTWGGGNHAYLWDPRPATLPDQRSCGQGDTSGHEIGPQVAGLPPGWGDQCNVVPGSDGKEDQIMNCCRSERQTLRAKAWVPFINDCHSLAGRCIKDSGLPNPGAPGGRLGKPCCSGSSGGSSGGGW